MWCVVLCFDFSWMWCCAAPVWRNMIFLWLLISFCLQLEHFGFSNFMLSGSSLLPIWSMFFVTVSLLHFDAPCFFQSPWTLFAQEYNVSVFWSWCCFVCSVIPTWYISSLVVLMRLPVLWFLMNSMCRPSKMEYDFYDAAGYWICAQFQHFAFWKVVFFWVPLCFNQELLRFFPKMMFYWFSVLHLDFPFLLDN